MFTKISEWTSLCHNLSLSPNSFAQLKRGARGLLWNFSFLFLLFLFGCPVPHFKSFSGFSYILLLCSSFPKTKKFWKFKLFYNSTFLVLSFFIYWQNWLFQRRCQFPLSTLVELFSFKKLYARFTMVPSVVVKIRQILQCFSLVNFNYGFSYSESQIYMNA